MPTWPTSLPGIPLSVESEAVDGLLVTEMDQPGATKRRRRFSVSTERLRFVLVVTGTQYDALLTFYTSDCSGGVSTFTFTDPFSGSSVTMAFRERPRRLGGLAGASTAAARMYDVEVSLERIP